MSLDKTSGRASSNPLHETAFWLALALPAAACAAPNGAGPARQDACTESGAPRATFAVRDADSGGPSEGPIELEPRRRCPGSRTADTTRQATELAGLAPFPVQATEAVARPRPAGRCSPR